MTLVHYAALSRNLAIIDAVLADCAGHELNLRCKWPDITIWEGHCGRKREASASNLTPVGIVIVDTINRLRCRLAEPEESDDESTPMQHLGGDLAVVQRFVKLSPRSGIILGSSSIGADANQDMDPESSGCGSLFSYAMSLYDLEGPKKADRARISLAFCLFLDAGLDPHWRDGSRRTPFSIWADITASIFEDEDDDDSEDYSCLHLKEVVHEQLERVWLSGSGDVWPQFTPIDLGIRVRPRRHFSLWNPDLDWGQGACTLVTHITDRITQSMCDEFPVWRSIKEAGKSEQASPSSAARLLVTSSSVQSPSDLAVLPSLPDGRPCCSCELCKQPDFSRLSLQLAAHSYVTSYFEGRSKAMKLQDGGDRSSRIAPVIGSCISDAVLAAVFPAIVHATLTTKFAPGHIHYDYPADAEDHLTELWEGMIEMAVILEDVPALTSLLTLSRRRVASIGVDGWFSGVFNFGDNSCMFGDDWINEWDCLAIDLALLAATPAAYAMLHLISSNSPCFPEASDTICEPCHSSAVSDRCCAPWIAVQALPHVRSQGALQALLDAGVNVRRWEGSTALQEAVANGNRKGALLLLRAGAFPGRLIDALRPEGERFDNAPAAGSGESGYASTSPSSALQQGPLLAEAIHESSWARRRWAIGAREAVRS